MTPCRWWTRFAGLGGWGPVLLVFLALLLSGCGSVELRPVAGSSWKMEPHAAAPESARAALERAPDCCGSLAGLPFEALSAGGLRKVMIGPGSPAHRFEQGKSFFAAYRISQLPRPARFEVASLRSAEPGSVLERLMPDVRQAVMQPTVLLLNEAFEVVRRLDALAPRTECAQNPNEPAFELSWMVTQPPAEVAYVVLMSSSESLAREGQKVCGITRHGMSPGGELQLQVRTLPPDLGPVRLATPVHWFAGARREQDVGLWQEIVAEPRLLVAGEAGLHVLAVEKARYRTLHGIAPESLVRASALTRPGLPARSLSVTAYEAGGAPGGRLQEHVFVQAARLEGDPDLGPLGAYLASRITPGRAAETIAWTVLPEQPALQVEGAIASRVGEAALAGGMVVAFPCGLCQAGACPPEVLAPCAGLFGIGAVLGGVTGVVKEVLAGPRPGDAARERLQSTASGVPALGAMELAQCLGSAIAQAPGGGWRDQGVTARLLLQPSGSRPADVADRAVEAGGGGAAGGSDYVAQVRLSELSLVGVPARKDSPPADAWRLKAAAQLRLTPSRTGKAVTRQVVWTGDALSSAEWLQQDSPRWAQAVAQACEQLSGALLKEAEKAWREP